MTTSFSRLSTLKVLLIRCAKHDYYTTMHSKNWHLVSLYNNLHLDRNGLRLNKLELRPTSQTVSILPEADPVLMPSFFASRFFKFSTSSLSFLQRFRATDDKLAGSQLFKTRQVFLVDVGPSSASACADVRCLRWAHRCPQQDKMEYDDLFTDP